MRKDPKSMGEASVLPKIIERGQSGTGGQEDTLVQYSESKVSTDAPPNPPTDPAVIAISGKTRRDEDPSVAQPKEGECGRIGF